MQPGGATFLIFARCGKSVAKMRWRRSENAVKVRWRRGEDAVKLRWRCGEGAAKMWWRYSEGVVKVRWRWVEGTVKMQGRRREHAVKVRWRWETSCMNTHNWYTTHLFATSVSLRFPRDQAALILTASVWSSIHVSTELAVSATYSTSSRRDG